MAAKGSRPHARGKVDLNVSLRGRDYQLENDRNGHLWPILSQVNTHLDRAVRDRESLPIGLSAPMGTFAAPEVAGGYAALRPAGDQARALLRV